MEIYRRNFVLSGLNTRYIDGVKKKKCKIVGISSADGKLMVENSKGDIVNIAGAKSIIIPDKIKVKNKS